MSLDVHRPYPGVALLVHERGSLLLGAPTDAFKATKRYCEQHQLPFPRVLVAPQRLLVAATPQFNPEFFLYDFLFMHGAAFKPELAGDRLVLVLDAAQVDHEKLALRHTLVGPSREEMSAWRDASGRAVLAAAAVKRLADVSEHMAIRDSSGRPRPIDDMVTTVVFDAHGQADVDGITLTRAGPAAFDVVAGAHRAHIDLAVTPPVVPFATLPVPETPQAPMTFGVKALGTRSGFDLSGPTTGFLIWINGRAVMYDGPVGTRFLLERQGIAPDDVAAVILSHCHEDHMGAFVELILAGHRPRVYTAEPIYRSALVKLAGFFDRSPQEVARLIDYQPVTPGEPVDLFGAVFELFYSVHAIPTVGVRVQLADATGSSHSLQISGDTMHHEGLDKMKEAGVLSAEEHARMRELVPAARVEGAVFLADVGEAMIHGHPKDWQGNPNRVLYYHCPDNDHTRGFGHELATPGQILALTPARPLHPVTPVRLLNALRFLEVKDPRWLATLLFAGRVRQAAAGDVLARQGEPGSETLTLIVAGTASEQSHGRPAALLKPGEFFGVMELVDANQRFAATVEALTPMELYDLDARTLRHYFSEAGAAGGLDRIRQARPLIDAAALFASLDRGARSALARLAGVERYNVGDHIIDQGQMADDFFLLVEGTVEIERAGEVIATIEAGQVDGFFGELSAIFPSRPRSATVRALTPVRTLRVAGDKMRELFESESPVRHLLGDVLSRRSARP
ncbi:MAG: cyclic nucleotide-binding domain-containing protein [Deltaproteobacteria bacterium]|nr:cyclic nucleotide-binding domain-containing protein [Deltaproteobacteria bacterium]